MTWDGIERRNDRRSNRLHDEDIDLIVSSITGSLQHHFCRFDNITTDDMKEVVKFTLKFKGVAEQTGMWVWKIIIGLVVTGGASLTALGFWTKTRGK